MNEEKLRILYKYRDWTKDFHQRLLTEGEIYFPSFDQLNDPFDGAIPFRYSPEQLTPENLFLKMRELAKHEHPDWNEQQIHEYTFDFHQKELWHDDRHWAEIQEYTKKEANTKFGVLSLAKRCDNYLLWSYYSNAHSGFCIGLNVEAFHQHLGSLILRPIVYQDGFPLIDLFGDRTEMVLTLFFTKGSQWVHEEEYRIVEPGYARRKMILPPEVIEEIILGVEMSQATKMDIIQIVEKRYPNARVFDMQMDDETFTVKPMQIR